MSFEPSTRAVGCASHVGYQKDRTSRRIWYRAPAPPSKPSNDGACRKSVCIIVRVIPDQLPNFRQLGSGNLSNSRVGQKSSQQIERTSIGHTLAPANTLAKEEHRPSALDAKARPDR